MIYPSQTEIILDACGERKKESCPFIGLCPAKLEHVSIKAVIMKDHGVGSERQPLSEEVIIQFVRIRLRCVCSAVA
jgi:hypothetical protein